MKHLLLDNIRSAHNVGSIFRTADGAGVEKIWLVGYTPTPTDRFGREQPEIKKTSLGASETVPWEHLDNEAVLEKMSELKKEEVEIVAVEQTLDAISIHDFTSPEKAVYILGNEIDGVSKPLLELADTVVEIPMLGQKESLNVSVVAGVALFAN